MPVLGTHLHVSFNNISNTDKSVCYVCLFDVKLPEDDLKKVEKFRSIKEFYVKLCL